MSQSVPEVHLSHSALLGGPHGASSDGTVAASSARTEAQSAQCEVKILGDGPHSGASLTQTGPSDCFDSECLESSHVNPLSGTCQVSFDDDVSDEQVSAGACSRRQQSTKTQ